ncbi:hypothetical protein BGZ95_004482 [Linnemannia exigua]|uniref:FAD-binding domain-containing protein n=1 Tax=Linnemannia exigua TaxID=604196 RepID=A0AAD4DHS2_9FUNG|nr:hypothetical protein BGZ95_004482 [Linnemannia exigua]
MTSPHILIVGAGPAGLFFAILMERAGISYEIFEKAKELRPVGSSMTLTMVMHLWEQLGLLEELWAISKPFGAINIRGQDMSCKGSFLSRFPGVDFKKLIGEDTPILARPDLIKLLQSRIPAHKVHYNKRVVRIEETDKQAKIFCQDDTSYSGTFIVGADGAYSNVRQHMYKEMAAEGTLPEVDAMPLSYDYNCLVGVSEPLDPIKYPVVEEKYSEFDICLGEDKDTPFTWWYMPLEGNRVGFMITEDIRDQGTTTERAANKSSEWDPNAPQDMCDRVRNLACPYGGTLGDILDKTPKETISKVVLEEKFFTTWYHRRTVLLGDACHKCLPFGGQGATMAIQSAVALANAIYEDLPTSQADVTNVFKKYFEERRGAGAAAVFASSTSGALMHKQGIVGNVIRYFGLNWFPNWIFQKGLEFANTHRPQLVFLPLVPFRGTFRGTKTTKLSPRFLAKLNEKEGKTAVAL